jgi:hypothetical protein
MSSNYSKESKANVWSISMDWSMDHDFRDATDILFLLKQIPHSIILYINVILHLMIASHNTFFFFLCCLKN